MKRVVYAILLTLLAGCAAKVGDKCETNTDCGVELSCDLSQPDGYCTASPCQANECPEEAACITFNDQSTFCMARCDDDSDCRSGYVCVTDYGDVAFCNASAKPVTTPVGN